MRKRPVRKVSVLTAGRRSLRRINWRCAESLPERKGWGAAPTESNWCRAGNYLFARDERRNDLDSDLKIRWYAALIRPMGCQLVLAVSCWT